MAMAEGVYHGPEGGKPKSFDERIDLRVALERAEQAVDKLISRILNGEVVDIVVTGDRHPELMIDGKLAEDYWASTIGQESPPGAREAGALRFEELLIERGFADPNFVISLLIEQAGNDPDFVEKLKEIDRHFLKLQDCDDRAEGDLTLDSLLAGQDVAHGEDYRRRYPGTPRPNLMRELAALKHFLDKEARASERERLTSVD